MDSWGLMNERVALQPRTRAADRNPIRISSPSAGRVVVDTGERGPHMLTILARIQLLNACRVSTPIKLDVPSCVWKRRYCDGDMRV